MRLMILSLLFSSSVLFAQQPVSPTPPVPAPTKCDAATTEAMDQMAGKLQDWPGLGRYREDNAKIGEPLAGVQRVVFLGDSITEGWGRPRELFFPGKPYINRGISGQTTPQILVRFQQDVVHLHPAVVVILAGINDIAENTGPEPMSAIEDNFRSMVALAKSAHIRVVISSVLPASSFPWRPGISPAARVRELNAWLEDFAQQEQVVYLNYYPALVDKDGGMRPELATDKAVHPNADGYAIMAPMAERAIAKALAMSLR